MANTGTATAMPTIDRLARCARGWESKGVVGVALTVVEVEFDIVGAAPAVIDASIDIGDVCCEPLTMLVRITVATGSIALPHEVNPRKSMKEESAAGSKSKAVTNAGLSIEYGVERVTGGTEVVAQIPLDKYSLLRA